MTYFNTPTPGNVLLTFLLLFIGLNYNLRGQALSGNYTIGGTTADYPTFRAAIAALDSFGVDGPVVFNVRSGVYEETDTIREIARTSITNTVTFQSESGDSTDVVLQWHSANTGNWNLWLYRTSHLVFRKIGFRQMYDAGRHNVLLIGGHDITFDNCLFEGSNMVFDGILLGGSVDSNLTVTGCHFRLARQALSLSSKGQPSKYLRLENNHINTQNSGFILRNTDSLIVGGNHFVNICGGRYVGLLAHNAKNLRIFRNTFKISTHGPHSRAIDLQNIVGNSASGNWVSNNVISMEVKSGDNAHALKMGNAGKLVIAHNTIRYDSPNPNHSAVRFVPEANGLDSCYFYNNLVANTGMGPGYSFNSHMNAELHNDYNLWYSGGGYITPGETNLSTVWARDSSNLHSLFEPPLFRGSEDLIADAPGVDSNAFPLYHIRYDILGNRRNSSVPDIGAFEKLQLPTLYVPNDTTGCESLTLNARSNASWFDWNTGHNSDSIRVTSSGTYWVTAINGDGSVSDTIMVTISTPVQFSILTPLDSVMPGQCINLSLSLAGDTNYSAIWSDSLGMIGNLQSVIVCPLLLPATYVVEVIDTNNCSSTDSITIFQTTHSASYSKPNGSQSNSPQHTGVNEVKQTSTAPQGSGTTALSIPPKVYPNPANGELLVEIATPHDEHPEIYLSDLAGNKMATPLQQNPGSGTYKLDLRPLASGSYILTIITPVSVHQVKITKVED